MEELDDIEEANRPPHGPADRTISRLVDEIRRMKKEWSEQESALPPETCWLCAGFGVIDTEDDKGRRDEPCPDCSHP